MCCKIHLLAGGISIVLHASVGSYFSCAAIVYQEVGGVVSMEAENYSERVNGNGHSWDSVANAAGIPGASSGGLFVNSAPNAGLQYDFAESLTPYLDYSFRISTAGTYHLHPRWEAVTEMGNTGTNDSFFAQIVEIFDGPGGTIGDYFLIGDLNSSSSNGVFGDDADWRPNQRQFEANVNDNRPTASWLFAPGDYTLRIHMREDGTVIDKLVLQLSSTAPTGLGPPESPIVPEPSTALTSVFTLFAAFGIRWRRPASV